MKFRIFSFLTALCLLSSPLSVSAAGTGDVNLDGKVNTEDVALLQNYLHKRTALSYAQWQEAERNDDGIVNIFDFCLLKREILTNPDEVLGTMLPVPTYCQWPDYPTGCESAALYILLRYYDADVTMEQIVSLLPKGALPHIVDGVTYGANPEREFVGDPRDANSYGVFNRPMAAVATLFRSDVHTKTGASLEEVISLLNQGIPVMVWFASNPERGITYRRSWLDDETGELIQWPSGEHAVVVCGYDQSTVTYRDPNTGSSRTVSQALFRSIFDEMGGRILYFQ